jgi:hypothetical protein
MVRRRGVVIVATVAGSLVVCALAQARIVVDRSIDGVGLGMSHAAVARILGNGKLEPGGGSEYGYRRGSYQVIFSSGHASSVETFDRQQRTSNGLRVGSSLADVRAREPRLHCASDAGEMDCYLGTIKRGHRYTDFFFQDGPVAVTAVIVGDGYL